MKWLCCAQEILKSQAFYERIWLSRDDDIGSYRLQLPETQLGPKNSATRPTHDPAAALSSSPFCCSAVPPRARQLTLLHGTGHLHIIKVLHAGLSETRAMCTCARWHSCELDTWTERCTVKIPSVFLYFSDHRQSFEFFAIQIVR